MNSRNFISRIIEDWPAKAISLLMAVFLLIFQKQNTTKTLFYDIPLNVKQNTSLIVATDDIPQKVNISVDVPEDAAAQISDNNFIARLDLSRYDTPGTYDVPIEIQNSGSALYIDLLKTKLNQKDVMVTLDKKETKTISVEANCTGVPAPGYEVTKVTITPPKVDVSGPASEVEKLVSIPTAEIDISESTGNIARTVSVGNVAPALNISEKNFQVNIEVSPIATIEEYNDIPIAIKNLSPAFEANNIVMINDIVDNGESDTEAAGASGAGSTGGAANTSAAGATEAAGGNEAAAENDNSGTLNGVVFIKTTQANNGAIKFEDDSLFIDCSDIKEPGDYTLPVSLNISQYEVISWEPKYISLTIVSQTAKTDKAGKTAKTGSR